MLRPSLPEPVLFVHFFSAAASFSGHTAANSNATAIPIDTSANLYNAIRQAGPVRGINNTTAIVIPPKRYALRSARNTAKTSPSTNTPTPNTSALPPKRLPTIAPTTAPIAVPKNRCQETVSAPPSDVCAITRVVIGAQYASCNRNILATSNEAIAATAVRADCTTADHPIHPMPSRAICALPYSP
jgi:hypothetical protein